MTTKNLRKLRTSVLYKIAMLSGGLPAEKGAAHAMLAKLREIEAELRARKLAGKLHPMALAA